MLTDVGIVRVGMANAEKKIVAAAKEFERLKKIYDKAKADYDEKYKAMVLLAGELGIATSDEVKEVTDG